MQDPNCLFCKIVKGEEPSTKIWEDDNFLAIKNKYPSAPVHILVIPKEHIEKSEVHNDSQEFWGQIMQAVFKVVQQLELDKTGYKLANYGAGYNHFEHEHVHVMGGTKEVPRD